MRYSAKHKQETRDRILRAASRRFRGRGEKRVAIADLMRELKLTHGGFYRHFASKQDLFAEGIAKGFEEVGERLLLASKAERPGSELRAIIESYLSLEHCENPAKACPVAALASDIARQPRAVRLQFEKACYKQMSLLTRFLPGAIESERQRNFVILFSGMGGALSMARAVADERTRQTILRDAREFYIRSFCS